MNEQTSSSTSTLGMYRAPFYRNKITFSAFMALLTVSLYCPDSLAVDKTFQFESPDSVSFVETQIMRKTVTMGSDPPQTQRVETQGRYTIRKTDSGWSVYVKPVKPLDMNSSADVSAIVNSLLAGLSFRYDLDQEGALVNIEGIEVAMAEVTSLLPPEFRSLMSAMGLNTEMIRQQAMARWQMLGLFDMRRAHGLTTTVNQARGVEAVYPSVIGGAFQTQGTAIFKGPMPCGKNDSCYEFVSKGTSQDPNIGQAMAKMLNSMLMGGLTEFAAMEGVDVPAIPEFSITNAKESVSMSRVFSEHTGLQHQYTQDHDVTAMMNVQDESVDDSEAFRLQIVYNYKFEFE